MADPAPRSSTFRLLTQGQYASYFAFNGLSLVGSWMQRIASAWLIWEWTGSAFWIGMLAACDLLPVVLTGPLAGVAADRWDRLRQNIAAQMATSVMALLNVALLVSGALGLYSLLVLVTLQGTLIAMVQPARLAMIQQLVRREDLPKAVALASVNVNLARLIGPAIAGVMILQAPIEAIFLLNFALTSLFVVVLMRLKLTPRTDQAPKGPLWPQMKEGFAYATQMPAIRLMMVLLFTGGVFIRALQEMTPALAAHSFATTATGLAILSSVTAAGAVLAGLTAHLDQPKALMKSVFLHWIAGALAAIGLILSRNPWPVSIASMGLGYSVARALIMTQTFVQLTTPDALRGRVLSLHGLLARASPALGALMVGYLADWLGLTIAISAAALCMALLGLGLYPQIRRLIRNPAF